MALYSLTQAQPQSTIISHEGGPIQVQASGTFGGAVLQLKVSQDGLPFQALSDYALTSPDILQVNLLRSSILYQFALDSASGTTDIQVSVL